VTAALRAARASGLLSGELVVLVSGGADSVCLLDVAAQTCSVRALHVNYGLRGAEADLDEAFVRDLCESLGVELVVHRAGAPPAAGNIQAWARGVRYGEAARLGAGAGAAVVVAVGHTADDQVETILYRLASSPGRRALLGMRPREGSVVRPLLTVTREDVVAHLRARGLTWREDESNAGGRFARGRVRHGLVPALRAVHPAAELNVLRTAELLREEADVLDELVAGELDGEGRVAVARLASLPAALARLVVVRLAEHAAGAPLPGVGARVAELCALASAGGSARLDVGSGAQAVVEYGVLRFECVGAVDAGALGAVELALPGRACFGSWELECELVQPGGEVVEGMLDAARVGQALTVRPWRHGDRMAPLGMGGATKTVADLFTDRRVPRAERASVPVLEAGGTIAWIPGVATGEAFRVSGATTLCARVRARRLPPG
jgi:tRNA(Ile)-lysidine synthase